MLVIVLSLLVCLIGFVIYMSAAPGSKWLALGLNTYTVGLFVFLFQYAPQFFKILFGR